MNKISLILSAIMTLALVLLMAPSIIQMNRGKTLRNIAIWLAIIAFLGLIYQNFGPGSAHELFGQSDGIQYFSRSGYNTSKALSSKLPPGDVPVSKDDDAKPDDPKNDDGKATGDQGYIPPKEE